MDGSTGFVPREFSGTTKITDRGIRNHFSKSVSPWRPLAELIWNGFDAKAKNVTASIDTNKLGGVESITVLDDGHGIDVDGSESSFFNFRDSKKKDPTTFMVKRVSDAYISIKFATEQSGIQNLLRQMQN